MTSSKAKLAAIARYDEKKYDKFLVRVDKEKGGKARIQAAAKSVGRSLNGFVTEAIEEKIARNAK
jgi:predicted HicB family RNase H-like nuclease